MDRRFRAVHAFSWSQTKIEGVTASPLDMVMVGAAWRWRGEALRLDGPQALLPLGPARGAEEIRIRAARAVRRWLKDAPAPEVDLDESPAGPGFTVTDGRRAWVVTLVDTAPNRPPVAVIAGGLPPKGRDLWVTQSDIVRMVQPDPAPILCFARGTLILCQGGWQPVENITPGMRVQTRDNGCQPVIHVTSRRISGARLQVEPELAPVRLRRGESELIVSPDHRILLRGPEARDLFNCDEVLAAARDLVDGKHTRILRGFSEVHYHHLALPRHEVILADGFEAESLLPADATLIDPTLELFDTTPARRILSRGEALIAARAA